jgi:uncharacterized membrane protein
MMAAWNASKEHPLDALPALAINTHPRGLAFNPSAWAARLPVIVLALAGFCLASYLAAYQLGFAQSIWEPFFGEGSRRVLQSFISRWLPVPDAALGASGYLAELLAGVIGGGERWRTTPWIVIVYGAIVAAVAATAVALACVQLFVIHAGCTLCLASAAISLGIALLARHEVFASVASIKERSGRKPHSV